MAVAILVGVTLLAVITYVTWEYRQGSFPKSRLRRHAKRAALLSRDMDREDATHESKRDVKR